MATIDISIFSLALTFILLALPAALSLIFGFNLIKSLFYSVARMSVQLILIGFFLKYLFEWNNAIINLLWLTVMILTAVYSAVKSSEIKTGKIFAPVFISFSFATFIVIFYLNIVVIPIENVFDARYLIVLGGMLLGNSLRGNIVGISAFYKNIRKESKEYLYKLSLGATLYEALLPYFRDSVRLALQPTLAAMATMGIVALPGMMTGVLLGGASPETAIKYQIVIMIAIVTSTILSVVLTILTTIRICFDKFGVLQPDVFIDYKNGGNKKRIKRNKKLISKTE
ncbi:MAG: ABC transporter permease [Chlorobi bacterium]|nr:ABC transporter permease [Chlorobiota bacterium]